MELTSAEAAPTALQIATTIIAAIAALAAIASAIIGSVLAGRRERATWLRHEQMNAYETYSGAAHDFAGELAGGAVDRSLHTPFFEGLDEAFDSSNDHHGAINSAIRKLNVVGQDRSRKVAVRLMQEAGELRSLSCPRSGAAHPAAMAQRLDALKRLAELITLADAAFRADLGIMDRRRRRKLDESITTSLDVPRLGLRSTDDAVANLRAWLVRDWEYNDAAAQAPWVRADYPWSGLRLNHRVLFQPLAAVVTKRVDLPWRAAVSSELDSGQLKEVLADIDVLVRHGGRGGETLFGGSEWVEGEVTGEQLWWWALDRLPSTSPA